MPKSGSLQSYIAIIKQALSNMPPAPGVYKMISAEDKILYVGKAKHLPKRVVSYTHFDKLSNRLKRMVNQIARIEYTITTSEAEALLLEADLIKSLKPVYNISLRDDKSFPYIFFDENHNFPRIVKYRGNKAEKGAYFGPFASAHQVKMAILELQKVFLLRPCTNNYFASRKRPCIQYEIKRCSAPCVNKISQAEYQTSVKFAKEFLRGHNSQVHNLLIAEMEQASAKLDYEKAAQLRDRIKILSAIQAKNIFADMKIQDADLIIILQQQDVICIEIYFIRGGKNYGNKAYFYPHLTDINMKETIESVIGQFYQHHAPPADIILNHPCQNPKILEEALSKRCQYKVKIHHLRTSSQVRSLVEFGEHNASQTLARYLQERLKHENALSHIASIFHIPPPIKRIEIYDNSHISGSNAVGCMVVYTSAGFAGNQYRKFNIKSANTADDYAILREVMERRLKRLTPENTPDLMLIDGGKGQMSAVQEVLQKLGYQHLNVICMSKGPDRNAGREIFHFKDGKTLTFDRHDKTLHFLQVLRDEAHRYAILSHRQKRAHDIKRSALDSVPNIGPRRKRELLRYFGSMDGIMSASITDLMRVRGISRTAAEKIFNYLHSTSYD